MDGWAPIARLHGDECTASTCIVVATVEDEGGRVHQPVDVSSSKPFRRVQLATIVRRVLGDGDDEGVDEKGEELMMAKVLIVEDDEDILGLVQARLKKAGHQVMAAGSAATALELIEDCGGPDIAVLDVGLPGLDGIELLDAVRERPGLAAMPAVFLSARVMPDDVERGRAKGATYLTKPFVASALLGAITKALDEASSGKGHEDGW